MKATIVGVGIFCLFLKFSPSVAGAGMRLEDDLFSVSFPTAQKGWAVGRWGTLLHTGDGAVSWQAQQSGTDYTLSSVFFVDGRTGWAVGDAGTILHTVDGGMHWQRQKSPVPFFLMDVAFVSPQRGWIVTERTTILATEDGGQSWRVQFADEDFILKAVAFADARHGWAVGEYGYIYHTADGGESWQHQAGEFDFSEETGEVVGGNYLFDVAAVSADEAWVVGIDGYLARTLDGGATWQPVTGVPKPHLFGVSVESSGEITVCGAATLVRSRDGGESWQIVPVQAPITYGWLYRIAERAGQGLVAVGSRGWTYSGGLGSEPWKAVGR